MESNINNNKDNDNNNNYYYLAPTGENPPSSDNPGSRPTKRSSKRNDTTLVACQPCRARKCKCDGARPICSACTVKCPSNCVYDVQKAERRTAVLKRTIRDLQSENDQLKRIVARALQNSNSLYDQYHVHPPQGQKGPQAQKIPSGFTFPPTDSPRNHQVIESYNTSHHEQQALFDTYEGDQIQKMLGYPIVVPEGGDNVPIDNSEICQMAQMFTQDELSSLLQNELDQEQFFQPLS